jgi:hypothetical protein
MKSITTVINEKLKLNKNSKMTKQENISKNDIDRIFELLYIPENHEQNEFILDVINKWINILDDDYNLIPCADEETLHALPKELKDSYNSQQEIIELCQEQLSNSMKRYRNNVENFEIRSTDNMICNINKFGTLYLLNIMHFKNK